MTPKSELGKKGELLVAHYLQKQGYTVLQTNYSIRGGEIDIIAQRQEVLAFIEVKMRSQLYFNTSEVVNRSKQNKIIHTARHYIAQSNVQQDRVYRFDIALVEPKDHDYTITYIPNAFTHETY